MNGRWLSGSAISLLIPLNAFLVYGQFTVAPIGHSLETTPVFLNGIVLAGTHAFAPNGNFGGLVAYDVSNPMNPTNVARATVGSTYAYELAISGTKAFVAGENTGLEIWDIANPANIFPLSQTNSGGTAAGVAVAGNFAYLANSGLGLWIYNVANPNIPTHVGHSTNGVFALGVAVRGNYAYVASSEQGLSIFDISNPSNPITVAQTNAGVSVRNVNLAGNYAYLQTSDGFRIYDISNPATPLYVGRNPTNYGATTSRITVSGDFVYLANGGNGLRIWNVSNPSSPFEAGSGQNTNTLAPVMGLAVSGDYLYAANGGYGLSVFKLSGPQLHVDVTGSTTAVVSWPTNTLNFRLQQSSNLLTGWLDLTNTPTIAGDRNIVTISPRNKADFYRLKL